MSCNLAICCVCKPTLNKVMMMMMMMIMMMMMMIDDLMEQSGTVTDGAKAWTILT